MAKEKGVPVSDVAVEGIIASILSLALALALAFPWPWPWPFKYNLRALYVFLFSDFSVSGIRAHQHRFCIALGPGLAFQVYPEAISRMMFPQLWAIFFFIMMVTLGIGSMVYIIMLANLISTFARTTTEILILKTAKIQQFLLSFDPSPFSIVLSFLHSPSNLSKITTLQLLYSIL